MQFISVASRQRHSLRAAAEIVGGIGSQFLHDQSPDLVFFFATPSHARAAERVAEVFMEAWPEALILGTTAAGVFHPALRSIERPAMVVQAAFLPNVVLAPIRMDLEDFEDSPVCLENWQVLLDGMPDPKLMVLLADPFTTPIAEILESLNTLAPHLPVLGGLSSGARRPGANVLVLDGKRYRSGLIGVALAGNVRADILVSQGCRPVGQLFKVTKANGNVVLELNGVPAMDALQDMVSTLPSDDQHLLQEGLMFGQAVQNPSDGFGRGDFLIRPVVAVDQQEGTISLAGEVSEGNTIRFHVWDDTLIEDLQMLLLPQAVDKPASGGFLFGSWPRMGGDRGRLSVPLRQIQQALGYRVPIAGFFTAGEIAPIRGANYLHMQTASLALLRPAEQHSRDLVVDHRSDRLN
ncbi:MAG: FIST C-terminal domain-containing protein [Candidatus Eisenbacteria sp.]|nr:FIST C-terminal domain-containing protein [Candidatus Eisenbacteria bacterium]